jgi:hypothetical protein
VDAGVDVHSDYTPLLSVQYPNMVKLSQVGPSLVHYGSPAPDQESPDQSPCPLRAKSGRDGGPRRTSAKCSEADIYEHALRLAD